MCVCVCELRLARGAVLSIQSSLSALCIMVWTKLSETEMTLAKKWHLEENLSAVQVAKRLGRSPSIISRLVIKRRPRKVQGRKPLLTKGMVDKLEAKVEAMIQKADSEYEVTVTMLKRASRCKAGTRTILRVLHKRGIKLRPLRQKPVLTEKDISER